MLRPAQSQTMSRPSTSSENPPKPVYVVVFGYPLDKYSLTVDYFRSIGEATEPEPNTEIVNCFRIGYSNPTEAMRAIRKNGETLSGAWMIGVKWAVRFVHLYTMNCTKILNRTQSKRKLY